MEANPRRAQLDWPPVVVAGAYQTGVVLMRNLVRRGLSVCCFDCNRSQPGFRTVYGRAHYCPNPDEKPDAWLSFMIALREKIGSKPVLIASADQFVAAMARHANALENSFIFSYPTIRLQAQLAEKGSLYALASKCGMPTAETQYVCSPEEVTAFGARARFPCVLKPFHSRHWASIPVGHPLYLKKAVLCDSIQDLRSKYQLAAQLTPEMIAQEVIEGPDAAKVVYISCYGLDGERIGACMVRELRASPMQFGSASVVEPICDPEADALCDQFLRKIGYKGLCEIELKRDGRDGCLKMIEANPRYSATGDAAPYMGLDLGWLHYLDLIGQDVTPVSPNGRDFRHVMLASDAATIRSYRRTGLLSWRELARSYRPPLVFFDFDLRDWRLTFSTILSVAKAFAGPAIRRILPKRLARTG